VNQGANWTEVEWGLLVIIPLEDAFRRGQLGPFLRAVALLPYLIKAGKVEVPPSVWDKLKKMGIGSCEEELHLFLFYDMREMNFYNRIEPEPKLMRDIKRASYMRVMRNLRDDIGVEV
jgi:hypothetical protein